MSYSNSVHRRQAVGRVSARSQTAEAPNESRGANPATVPSAATCPDRRRLAIPAGPTLHAQGNVGPAAQYAASSFRNGPVLSSCRPVPSVLCVGREATLTDVDVDRDEHIPRRIARSCAGPKVLDRVSETINTRAVTCSDPQRSASRSNGRAMSASPSAALNSARHDPHR